MTNDENKNKVTFHTIIVRVVAVSLVLVLGVMLMGFFASMKKAPEEVERPEAVAIVDGIVAEEENYQTTLYGYGTATSHVMTTITPQVSGRVIEVHPDLEVGNIIPKGEVLLKIDPTDYRLSVEQAKADLASAKARIDQINIQNKSDQRSLEITRRMTKLAQNKYDRFKTLFNDNRAESEASLEAAELELNRQEESLISMENRIAKYESDLAVAEANVAAAMARVDSALENLKRTEITSPYDARIISKDVELMKLVSANSMVLMLADDSVLEIPVSIDSREVANWLRVERAELNPQWFKRFENYPVQVAWTSDTSNYTYIGQLDRVENFNEMNRTFSLIVQVRNNEQSSLVQKDFPLSSGMFCELAIPGRVAENVIAVPREAVDSQGIVLTSEDGRLKSNKVEIARIERDTVLVKKGLQDGDIVLTRRPPSPVDGMKLEVNLKDENGELIEVPSTSSDIAASDDTQASNL